MGDFLKSGIPSTYCDNWLYKNLNIMIGNLIFLICSRPIKHFVHHTYTIGLNLTKAWGPSHVIECALVKIESNFQGLYAKGYLYIFIYGCTMMEPSGTIWNHQICNDSGPKSTKDLIWMHISFFYFGTELWHFTLG